MPVGQLVLRPGWTPGRPGVNDVKRALECVRLWILVALSWRRMTWLAPQLVLDLLW